MSESNQKSPLCPGPNSGRCRNHHLRMLLSPKFWAVDRELLAR